MREGVLRECPPVVQRPVWLSFSCEAGFDVAERMLNEGGHFYVCGSARQVPEDIYTAMKEAKRID